MKKAIRYLFSLTLLSSLTISQIPAPAACQMIYGAGFTASCSMPCCKAGMPMSKCPMLKAAAPRDALIGSTVAPDTTLQSLHHVGALLLLYPHRSAALAAGFIDTLRFLFSGPPPALRGPPSDILLLDA